jgi:hypothetical protein
MTVRADLMGKRFGRLVAVECIGPVGSSIAWRFLCDCGNEKIAAGTNATSGKTKSCGCLHSEVSRAHARLILPLSIAARTKHGMSPGAHHAGSKVYSIWSSMRQRCRNPKNKKYADYGARGIYVCARWDEFLTFMSDMGPRPEGTSIDRIDNDGPYSPENCRWATASQQVANQRHRKDSRWIEYNGERHTITEWARITGIKSVTLFARFDRYGWPPEKALAA